MYTTNMEELWVECLPKTRWKPANAAYVQARQIRSIHQVHEVYVSDDEPGGEAQQEERVEALYWPREGGSDKLTHWNCAQRGHIFWECESYTRNSFCYKCCLPGVVLPKFPNCQAENSQEPDAIEGFALQAVTTGEWNTSTNVLVE